MSLETHKTQHVSRPVVTPESPLARTATDRLERYSDAPLTHGDWCPLSEVMNGLVFHEN